MNDGREGDTTSVKTLIVMFYKHVNLVSLLLEREEGRTERRERKRQGETEREKEREKERQTDRQRIDRGQTDAN